MECIWSEAISMWCGNGKARIIGITLISEILKIREPKSWKILWNCIWRHTFIEITSMCVGGHGKAKIIGITLKSETLNIWELNQYFCKQVKDILTLRYYNRPFSIKQTQNENLKLIFLHFKRIDRVAIENGQIFNL